MLVNCQEHGWKKKWKQECLHSFSNESVFVGPVHTCRASCLHSQLWQKWCGFGKVLLCITLTWLYLSVHASKLLLLYLTEKWLWNIHSHLSWIYMKMKITSSILVYSLMNNSSSCTQLFIIIIINYVCIAGKDRKAVTAASWEMLNLKNLVRPRCVIWEKEDRQW